MVSENYYYSKALILTSEPAGVAVEKHHSPVADSGGSERLSISLAEEQHVSLCPIKNSKAPNILS